MSFNFTMTDVVNTNTTYQKISEEFCKVYYHKMQEGGFSFVMQFFSRDAKCTLDNQELTGCYDILIKLSQLGIHKFLYKRISGNSQPVGDSILITTIGEFIPINFQKQTGRLVRFTETFILKYTGDNYLITNYILKTMK